jgi:lipopolysaccharide transport system permease protein
MRETIIESKSSPFKLNLREVWQYRDLLLIFVRRDVVSLYKQTILGPLWFFIQPLLTTLMFTFIFGNIAGISTGGIPKLAFYLGGVVCWSYFSTSLMGAAQTFITNAGVFGKVYFPRLVAPLALIISNLIKLGVQFLLFVIVCSYYWVKGDFAPNIYLLAMPLIIVIMGMLSLGLGLIISSLTTKYRDLKFLLEFGVQLFMYATPVIYPFSSMPEKIQNYLWWNPMAPIVESFRYMFTGAESFDWLWLGYSFSFALISLIIAIPIFNKVEKTFMDTV